MTRMLLRLWKRQTSLCLSCMVLTQLLLLMCGFTGASLFSPVISDKSQLHSTDATFVRQSLESSNSSAAGNYSHVMKNFQVYSNKSQNFVEQSHLDSVSNSTLLSDTLDSKPLVQTPDGLNVGCENTSSPYGNLKVDFRSSVIENGMFIFLICIEINLVELMLISF